MALEIHIKALPHAIKLIEFKGEMNAGGGKKVDQEILPIIEKETPHLIADLTGLSYIDSTGICSLMHCFLKAKGKGGILKLIGINEHIKETLEAIGLTKVIPSYNNLEQALADSKT